MDTYIFDAALICSDCAEAIAKDLPPIEQPEGPYMDGGGEADCPQHCDHCGTFLENPLTQEGEMYVINRVNKKERNSEVLAEWKEFYAYLFGTVDGWE